MSALRAALFVTVILCYGETVKADQLGTLVEKATSLATTYLSNDQIKSFIQKVTDEAWSGKTTSQIAQALIPWALQKITPMQYTDVMATFNNVNNQFGSSNKTWSVIYKIIDVGSVYVEPYKNNIYNQWEIMKTNGKNQTTCYNKAWTMAAGYFIYANIEPALDALKKEFTPSTCNIGYTNLNNKFVLLDQYGFTSTPCTGTM